MYSVVFLWRISEYSSLIGRSSPSRRILFIYRFSCIKTSPSLRSSKVCRKQFLTSMKKTKTRKQAKIILTFSRLVLISFSLPYDVHFTCLIMNLIMDTGLSSVLTTNNLMRYEYLFNLTCKWFPGSSVPAQAVQLPAFGSHCQSSRIHQSYGPITSITCLHPGHSACRQTRCNDLSPDPAVSQHRVQLFCQLKSMLDIVENDLLK